MAVLARPINLSFEIDPKKTNAFFESIDKQAYSKAIERAKKHGYNPTIRKDGLDNK